ncbi:MAG: sugar phosphate isomerase [Candidatus Hydrogenedentota bacterium]
MLEVGVVSVTFRNFGPRDVIKHALAGRVSHIEWSADRHVPTGGLDAAREVGAMTRDAGLSIAGYGAYYKAGLPPMDAQPFEPVLETAMALGATNIRIWAGDKGSSGARESYWNAVVQDTLRIADLAQSAGLTISFEFQSNTLNDTGTSSERLMQAIKHPAVFTYWQPDSRLLPDERLEGLNQIRPWLKNIHVFHWSDGRRQAFADGEKEWLTYLTSAAHCNSTRVCLIEFVKDDLLTNFVADANILRSIVTQANGRVKRVESTQR